MTEEQAERLIAKMETIAIRLHELGVIIHQKDNN